MSENLLLQPEPAVEVVARGAPGAARHERKATPADVAAPPAAPSTARRRLRDELDRLTSVRSVLAGEALDQETEAESVGELSSIDQHPADLGSETFERERELSLLEDVEAEIADVRRALVRLDRGGLRPLPGVRPTDPRRAAVCGPGGPLLLRAPSRSRGDRPSGDLNRRAVAADVRDAAPAIAVGQQLVARLPDDAGAAHHVAVEPRSPRPARTRRVGRRRRATRRTSAVARS